MINYPYNYFETQENISVNKLSYIPNVFNERIITKSILEDYKVDIDNYIKNNKLDLNSLKNFTILEHLSNDYFNKKLLNEKNVDLFSKLFIQSKYAIIENQNYINLFLRINKKINNKLIQKYSEDKILYNPINSTNIDLDFLNKDIIINNINRNLYRDDTNKIKILLDIMLHGNIINNTLPSIGLIKQSLSIDTPKLNFCDFIYDILNIKDNENISNKIPLLSLDIGDKIGDLLLNISNNFLYNINSDKIKDLIKNMIKGIKINLENIFFENTKVKNQYIIPYDVEKNLKTQKNEIKHINKNKIDRIKNFNDLIYHNNKAIVFVLTEIYVEPESQNIGLNNIEKPLFKEVLASFLFYIIRLIYDIYKEYINKIENIITDIAESRNKRFGFLNIIDTFEYIKLLNISLLKFKKILLNNFYNLFIPSKIDKFNYGFYLNENNLYVPQLNSVFLASSDKIYEEYPFNKCNSYSSFSSNKIDNPFKLDLDKILLKKKIGNFILNSKEKNDIYDNSILGIGIYAFDNKIMNYSNTILTKYYNLLYKNNSFVLFIINIILDNFNVKKCIPYELINDLNNDQDIMKMSILSQDEYENIEKKLINKYEFNNEKLTLYYLKVLTIRKNIKLSKKENLENMYKLEQISLLSFNIYVTKSLLIKNISEKMIVNIKLKNSLKEKFINIKKIYEKKIANFIKKL
jgi:hypothetical protein